MTRIEEIEALGLPSELTERLVACEHYPKEKPFSIAMDAVVGGWAGETFAKLATAIDAHPLARYEFLATVACFGYRDVPPDATAELARLGVLYPGANGVRPSPVSETGRDLVRQINRVRLLTKANPGCL